MVANQMEWYRREEKYTVDSEIYKDDFMVIADGPGSVLQALQEEVDILRAEGYTRFQLTINSLLPGVNFTRLLSPYSVQIYANGKSR